MGRYRAKDLVNPPTLLSLCRVPLAVVFPFVQHNMGLSLLVLGLAGGSDVLDGFIARHFHLTTPMGAVVDGVTDKIFVGVVLATLVTSGLISPLDLVFLGAREIGELPLVVWLALSPRLRQRKVEDKANVFGKVATVLQFSTIVAVIGAGVVHSAARPTLLWLTGLVGGAAALSYWHRTLKHGSSPKVARQSGHDPSGHDG